MAKNTCKGHRRCSGQCPPAPRSDGTYSRSLISLCLICWNTGCQIPTTGKSPGIDAWIAMHGAEDRVPPKAVQK